MTSQQTEQDPPLNLSDQLVQDARDCEQGEPRIERWGDES